VRREPLPAFLEADDDLVARQDVRRDLREAGLVAPAGAAGVVDLEAGPGGDLAAGGTHELGAAEDLDLDVLPGAAVEALQRDHVAVREGDDVVGGDERGHGGLGGPGGDEQRGRERAQCDARVSGPAGPLTGRPPSGP
jgi:hypothetical protein